MQRKRSRSSVLMELTPLVSLHRDVRTGLAWVTDGKTGLSHSAHPNIDVTGSIRGMKGLGYWGKKDRIVRCRGYYHNVSKLAVHDYLDKVAAEHCHCIGCQTRPPQ